MAVFCTFHVFSGLLAELPKDFLKSINEEDFVFIDHSSIDRQARRARVRKNFGLDEEKISRYQWRLCSDDYIETDDLYSHIDWVLRHIRSDAPLFQLLGTDYKYWISVFWEGNGTGGGPLIDTKVIELLAYHKLEMGISFYLDREDS